MKHERLTNKKIFTSAEEFSHFSVLTKKLEDIQDYLISIQTYRSICIIILNCVKNKTKKKQFYITKESG